MFMRNNRAKNGAAQPEQTAAANAAEQRKARKLSPNLSLDGSPDDWRFNVDLSSCDRINDAHYDAGISSNLFLTDYEQHIPYVGSPDTVSKAKKLSVA